MTDFLFRKRWHFSASRPDSKWNKQRSGGIATNFFQSGTSRLATSTDVGVGDLAEAFRGEEKAASDFEDDHMICIRRRIIVSLNVSKNKLADIFW